MSREELVGATWQCPECQAYWEPETKRSYNGTLLDFTWRCTARPQEQAHLREIEAALDGAVTATAPTVTLDMVQLILDTYSEHMTTVPSDDTDALGTCGECGAGIYGQYTIQAHAREMATNVLQDALNKAGRDAQE